MEIGALIKRVFWNSLALFLVLALATPAAAKEGWWPWGGAGSSAKKSAQKQPNMFVRAGNSTVNAVSAPFKAVGKAMPKWGGSGKSAKPAPKRSVDGTRTAWWPWGSKSREEPDTMSSWISSPRPQ